MARGRYVLESERQRMVALFRAGHRKAYIAEQTNRPLLTVEKVLRAELGSARDNPKPLPPVTPVKPREQPVRRPPPVMTEADVLRARRPCNQRFVDWTECPMAKRWLPWI